MTGSTPPTPVDCNIDFNTSHCAGKTAIVTGGANGIGEAYVRALAAADVAVCIADLNKASGERLASELPNTKFVQCDVLQWEDQLRLFREARDFSPSGKIHFVVANAGIASKDEVFAVDESTSEPTKPNLKIIDVNVYGTMYTIKLAMHAFVQQNGTSPHSGQEDTCLVLISSGAGYCDVPRSVQYSATKWAMRGVMHGLRRVMTYCGSRVNVIAPWYVRTSILTKETFDHVQKSGVEFAEPKDAGDCLLRLLSDPNINGKCLFIAARKWSAKGYLDLDLDEYRENPLLDEIQADQMRSAPASLGLFI